MEKPRKPSWRSLHFSGITQLLPWVLLKTELVINLNIYLIWGKENKLLIVSAAARIARDLLTSYKGCQKNIQLLKLETLGYSFVA